jgi:hypothetical protein
VEKSVQRRFGRCRKDRLSANRGTDTWVEVSVYLRGRGKRKTRTSLQLTKDWDISKSTEGVLGIGRTTSKKMDPRPLLSFKLLDLIYLL